MADRDQRQQERLARALKEEAMRLGFEACGISRAVHLDDEARRLEQWLQEGRHGTMSWMERNFEKRVDPRVLIEGAQTVVSVLQSYYQPVPHSGAPDAGLVSRYAWGDDYHQVMKEKLFLLFEWLQEQSGTLNGRVFVDSAPVMDKAWAARSGLGWQGKHTNLINSSLGTYFFIGEMIVDLPLAPDGPVPDHCGSCTRCIDACPTDAIFRPYAVDANRCISYLTIEYRGEDIPADIRPGMGNWIFGCDICQDVCPWNKFKKVTREDRYLPRDGMPDTPLGTWMELDLETFRQLFQDNPVKRTKYEGLMRNIRVATASTAGAPQSQSPFFQPNGPGLVHTNPGPLSNSGAGGAL